MDRMNSPLAADQLRFASYLEALSGVLGHADRVAPLKAYCTGLLLPGARKSIEPMAARIAPARVQATHQALHHFVAKGEWSDDALLAQVRSEVLPVIERQASIQAWIVDDTGFPKKGRTVSPEAASPAGSKAGPGPSTGARSARSAQPRR